jgi:fucose permease
LAGSLGLIFSKQILGNVDSTQAYHWMWASGFIMGCGNGWTEVGINPLVATLYPKDKTHYLNILHAWWPGGLVIGGLLAIAVRSVLFAEPSARFLGLELWQTSLLLIPIPALIYGSMLIGTVFPRTERVASGVSTGEMLKEALRPMFLFWAFCMLLTAATELGPQKWQNSVMSSMLNISWAGTLILVYTSGMMFVLRHFAGPIAHRLSPVGMLTGSALLSCIGLFLLSTANSVVTAFGFATIYGLGIAYFWPTMLGVAAERFPKGGALILALMGTAGNISIGFALDEMGKVVDRYSVAYVEEHDPSAASTLLKKDDHGAAVALNEQVVEKLPKDSPARTVAEDAKKVGFSMAFRWVSILPLALIFIFGAIALSDRMKGGYKAVHIEDAIGRPATSI